MNTKSAISVDLRKFRPAGFREELVPNDGILIPREMQQEAMDLLGQSHHVMILAPTGVGKSKGIGAISVHQRLQGAVRKNIKVVPQTVIGRSYGDFRMRFKDIGVLEYEIAPADRLTSPDTPTTSKTDGVLDFLQSDIRTNLVCTYTSFLIAYGKLSGKDKKRLFKDTRIWIDECHHLAASVNGSKAEFNRLGTVVNELMSLVPSCRIGMATATYCRGDLQSILTPESYKEFVRYSYPYDRYFASMKYLESFEYKFVNYRRRKKVYEPARLLGEIFDERLAKTIVYIPTVQSRCSHGKQYEVQKILEALGKDENGKRAYPEDEKGIIRVVRKDGTRLKVVNLVSETGRDIKKRYVEGLKKADDLDVVIALGMFKEGADWEFAERSIVIGYRGSLVEMIQITGRLFRDVPGKTNVEVIHMLEACLATDEEEFEGDLNKMMTATLGAMLMENVFSPIRLISEKKKGTNGREEYIDYFEEAVPADCQPDFLADVYSDVSRHLKTFRDGEETAKFRKEEFDGIVEKHLRDGGWDTAHVKEIAEKVWRTVVRRSPRFKGLDIGDVDIKLVHRVNPLSAIYGFMTGKLNEKTFLTIRRAFLHRKDIMDEEWREMYDGVMEFEKKKNRKPDVSSSDVREQELGKWLVKWQALYNRL